MVGVAVVMGQGGAGPGRGRGEVRPARVLTRNLTVIGFVGSEGAAAWVAAEGNLGRHRGRIAPWKKSEFPTKRPTRPSP